MLGIMWSITATLLVALLVVVFGSYQFIYGKRKREWMLEWLDTVFACLFYPLIVLFILSSLGSIWS